MSSSFTETDAKLMAIGFNENSDLVSLETFVFSDFDDMISSN